MVSARRFYMVFGRVWRPWKALGGVMEASGSCLGRLGQALGRLLGAILGRLGRVSERLWRLPGSLSGVFSNDFFKY